MRTLHDFTDMFLHRRVPAARSAGARWLARHRPHLPSASTVFRIVVAGSLIAAVVLTWFLKSGAGYLEFVSALDPGARLAA